MNESHLPKRRHPIRRIVWRTLKVVCLLMITLGVLGATFGMTYVQKTVSTIPKIDTTALKSDASTNIYSANHTLIYSSSKNKRIPVKFADLPTDYVHLLIATEDHDFYKTKGLSPKGLLNAGLSYLGEKLNHGTARGGSTIEQQLMKLTVFSTSAKDRTISRKIKEAFLANQLYRNYSKNQILEFYVNKIYLGEGSYGAATIANTYYGKPLKDLSLSQLAIIAGLGQAPSTYNLYDNPKGVEQRRNQVLTNAKTYGYIDDDAYQHARKTPVTDGLKPRHWHANEIDAVSKQHDAYISSVLAQIKTLGYDIDRVPLQVTTALDVDMNVYLKQMFDQHPEYFQDEREQAAMTVIDPKTGQVLAQNGGRFNDTLTGLNRATSTVRSTGSAIKPILDYGPAVEYLGWGTRHPVDGSPYHYAGTNIWAYNYGGESVGIVPMEYALSMSFNPPAIRTLDAVGPERAKRYAAKFGITQDKPFSGSEALGVDTSTEHMAAAMAAYSNHGIYHQPQYVTELKFPDDSVRKIQPEGTRAAREGTAYIITDMLKKTISPTGVAPKAKIDGVVQAMKTGTVGYPDNANVPPLAAMEAWVTGYTKSLAIAFWQGYDTPMAPNSYLTKETTMVGRLNLYRDFLTHFSKGRDNSDWAMPEDVRQQEGLSMSPLDDVTKHHLTNPLADYPKNSDNAPYYDSKQVNSDTPIKQRPKDPKYNVPDGYKIGGWQSDFEKKKADEQAQDDQQYPLEP